jgi:uncharacterized cupin superfamily protein
VRIGLLTMFEDALSTSPRGKAVDRRSLPRFPLTAGKTTLPAGAKCPRSTRAPQECGRNVEQQRSLPLCAFADGTFWSVEMGKCALALLGSRDILLTMREPLLHIDQVEFTRELKHAERFDARVGPISTRLGCTKLAYNITVVAPGKRAFPFHNHHVNEEMFFILEGTGTLRFGTAQYEVRAGHIIACPPGGPEVAHQLINTGDALLKYLALSTTVDTDVFQYPDSGKFGVVAGRKPDTRPLEAPFAGFYLEGERKDYWLGE